MKIQLDMYQTMAVAVVVLMLGSYLRKKIDILERFCIPAPVVGGFLFAIFTCICYVTHILEFSFDDTLKEVCMVFFFTSVGFQANLKVLKKGGKSMVIFLGLVIVLIFIQNGVAVGLSKVIGLDSLIGMCTGSIPMVGGHGTAGAFGPVLEDFNVKGATTICTAAATFGLFTNGLKQFDEYYEQGLISKVLTTNVIYQTPDLLSRPYYINVDLSKYIALMIDKLNYDHSISELLDPNAKIQNSLAYYRKYHK